MMLSLNNSYTIALPNYVCIRNEMLTFYDSYCIMKFDYAIQFPVEYPYIAINLFKIL